MIQVEVAGPRNPPSIELIPDEVRDLAKRVKGKCIEGTDHFGGFITADMSAMKNWVVNAETDLNDYYRKYHPTSYNSLALTQASFVNSTHDLLLATYTSFITVALTGVVSDWLSPGNYDPTIPHILAQAEFAAIPKAPAQSPSRNDLLQRANRFLRQELKMEPRGHRIPWWENPSSSNVASLQHGNGMGSVSLPDAGNSTNTAQSKRKRRVLDIVNTIRKP